MENIAVSGRTRGSVLISSLWVLMLLTIFAVSLARGASMRIKFAGYLRDKVISHYLARAGIRKVIQYLIEDQTPDYDAFNDLWASSEESFKDIRLGGGKYTVSYTTQGEDEGQIMYGAIDEESKININYAPVEILSRLLMLSSNSTIAQAGSIADSIIDWRDEDSDALDDGAEDIYYEGLVPSYTCKDAPFESLEELLLVKGMTGKLLENVRNYSTVYGEGAVNINTAGTVVLEALGVEYSLVSRIVSVRRGGDAISGTVDDNVFTGQAKIMADLERWLTLKGNEKQSVSTLLSQNMLSTVSNNFRVISKGYRNDPRSIRSIEAVVDRADIYDIKVAYWHEE